MLVTYPVNTLPYGQDTFSGQAFGAGDFHLCGQWLNRGFFIMTSVYIPLALLIAMFAESIFLSIGQPPEVASLAARQVCALLPAIYLYSCYQLLRRWLACLRQTQIPFIAILTAFVLHQPLCVLFLFKFEWGIIGLAVAQAISNSIALLIVVVSIW